MQKSESASTLVLHVYSFSYMSGIPRDETEHGGGFVFDCRCLPNPGREARFADQTGRDREVKEYLEACPEVEHFYASVASLVEQAVSNYQEREFNHLMIAFGCTGGQHRSVYMAERLTEELRSARVRVFLCHSASERWGKAEKR